VRQLLGASRILLHAQIQRSPGEYERIAQSLLHLDLEPAIDTAIQEVEREQVDDEQRRDDESAEDADRTSREARAGNMIAIVADQLPQLARELNGQGDDAGDIEQQNPRLQAIERGRVLNALREQQQSANADRGPQKHQSAAAPRHTCRLLAVYTGSDHEYHSLTRRKSSVQKNSARSDAGNRPRRTPARTLIR
jgi:hypothetical protein